MTWYDTGANEHKTQEKRWILIAISVILLFFVAIGTAYINSYYHADEMAVQAMASNGLVTVSELEDGTVLFTPSDPCAGLIFYPGGKVEYTAYGPQDGDGVPSISREEQIARTLEEIQAVIK